MIYIQINESFVFITNKIAQIYNLKFIIQMILIITHIVRDFEFSDGHRRTDRYLANQSIRVKYDCKTHTIKHNIIIYLIFFLL